MQVTMASGFCSNENNRFKENSRFELENDWVHFGLRAIAHCITSGDISKITSIGKQQDATTWWQKFSIILFDIDEKEVFKRPQAEGVVSTQYLMNLRSF